ncbi:MAG: Hsp20/alpha crystallin family protein [Bacteroidota bacterium]
MKLIRSNITPGITTFFNDILDHDHFWKEDHNGWSSSVPAVNVSEGKDAFTLELAAPGLSKKDFKVNVDNGLLSISSERKSENEDKQENYTRKEFSYQSFTRSFSLPDTIEANKIKANYANGLLQVALPKKEEKQLTAKKDIIVG